MTCAVWSLNEIESTTRKAARGGGMTWGLAEEAGRAARWLSARELPGPDLIAALLVMTDGVGRHPLRREAAIWTSDGTLCPIAAGASLCDFAGPTDGVTLRRVTCPLLLAPFAATCGTVGLNWPGVQVWLGDGALRFDGDPARLTAPTPVDVFLHRGDAHGTMPEGHGRLVSAKTVATLAAFASRTFAPATEASRAGAGGAEED